VVIVAVAALVAPIGSSGSGLVIGHLKWEVVETATSRVLDHGEGPVYLDDVVVREGKAPDGRFTPKFIRLSRQFSIEMSEFPAKLATDKGGFGIVGLRSGLPTFSWEWFNIRDHNHAIKLQEKGELGIRLEEVGPTWEIVRTDFNTDISLRVIRDDMDSPRDIRWRINIAKGSTITWPSMINGKVVPN
jgi:hypothetical protein